MKTAYQLLKLQQHKHTGKLLHHRHTSYRMLFLLMLMPIIMFAMVGQVVGAEDYQVSAVVPAPLPGNAPVITSPINGSTTTTATLAVRGTCPLASPAVVIAIYDGTTLLGSGQCRLDKTFEVPVTLVAGAHTLVASVKTITGQNGANSQPVTVTYSLVDEKPGNVSGTIPLSVNAGSSYIIFGPHTDAIWRGSFAGGAIPYAVLVNWGDNKLETFNVSGAADQAFTHHYDTMRSYDIKLVVTDIKGATAQYHTAAATYFIQTALLPSSVVAQTTGFAMSSIGLPVAQVYVGTLIPLTGLWFFEHRRFWLHFLRSGLLIFHQR